MTGGSGADAYRVGIGSQGVTIHDFSLAKGDTLTVDSFFKGKAIEMSDGAGGTISSTRPVLITFSRWTCLALATYRPTSSTTRTSAE